jgi:hypothetical protein
VRTSAAHIGAITDRGTKAKTISGDRIIFNPVNVISTYAGSVKMIVKTKNDVIDALPSWFITIKRFY